MGSVATNRPDASARPEVPPGAGMGEVLHMGGEAVEKGGF